MTIRITISLRPFCETTGSTDLAAVQISCTSESTLQSYTPRSEMALQLFSIFSHIHVTSNKHAVHYTSKFYNLREPTGSDYRQLSHKLMPLYICRLKPSEVPCFTFVRCQSVCPTSCTAETTWLAD